MKKSAVYAGAEYNCNFFASEVKRNIAKSREPVKTVLIAAETMNDIDITGADCLIKLNAELNRKNIVMVLTHVRDPLRDEMQRMGVIDAIGASHIYETTQDGVDAFVTSRKTLPAIGDDMTPRWSYLPDYPVEDCDRDHNRGG